jgi:ferritin-like metal-binding protein YciE
MENAKKNENDFSVRKENQIESIKPKFDGEAGLKDLLVQELQMMYYLEKTVSKSFPKIIKNSCNFELIEALYIHQKDTEKQLLRIEESFNLLQVKPILQRCVAIEAMVEELDEMIEITKFGIIRDAGIILSLHKIEHYEIASYSILTLYAENLKLDKIQTLLDLSLNEERVAQMRLAKIANTIRFYKLENP